MIVYWPSDREHIRSASDMSSSDISVLETALLDLILNEAARPQVIEAVKSR